LTELKGITWDHKRGYDPLITTTETFKKMYPDVNITWDKRSLSDFGNYPVEKLVDKYDLLLIDHPFIGEACKKELFLDLKHYLSKEELKKIEDNTVGNTFYSYTYDNKILALPVDAAAIVSAAKKEWFDKHGENIPRTFNEVIEFGKKYSGKVITPLCAIDIWCVFLSLCSADTDGKFIDRMNGIDLQTATEQIEKIYSLIEVSAGDPFELNPINVLDLIANGEDYCYSPYLFGYVNYSIAGEYKNIVSFYDVPLDKKGNTTSLLGGVGVAVSKNCCASEIAVKYANYIARPDIQSTLYFESGGQPAVKISWLSNENNRKCNDFFVNTLNTVENAFVRPRFMGWNVFQEKAGELLAYEMSNGTDSKIIADKLNDLFKSHFC